MDPGIPVRIPTVMGPYTAFISSRGVQRLLFPGVQLTATRPDKLPPELRRHARGLKRELAGYFRGRQTRFRVLVDLAGHSDFRVRVWQAMQNIRFGQVVTYGELARLAGCGSARAIGQACAANPVPVIIPCHRVVAAAGLGGWSGRAGMKERLLTLEGVDLPFPSPPHHGV